MTIQINGTSGISGVDGSAATPALQGSDTNTGISFGTDEVNINTGGTTRAKIDSSGKLLVGTSSDATGDLVQIRNTAGEGLGFWRNSSANGIVNGQLQFKSSIGITSSIQSYHDGSQSAGSAPGRLVFSTTAAGASSPTERVRVGSNGSLGVLNGSGSGGNTIGINSPEAAGTSSYLILGNAGASSTLNNTGSNVFRVYTNGNVQNTNNSYAGISDIKLKENIVDANSQWNDLKALQVRNYNFKEETGHQTHTQIGLIAQEAELVSPGLVSETLDRETIQIPILDENGDAVLDENGDPTFTTEERETGEVTKSVNYSVLYMKAVKALQEAMERIETFEARLTALEGGINS